MKTTRTLLLPLLFLAGASLAEAQGVGSRMPEVELEGYSQTKADSFEDFQGRAVLLEFFAYWWGPCAGQVVHLNELQEKFGPKGLSILAVTDEGESETVKWIQNKGAQYAYAYDKGGKLSRHFNVQGIPHAVLIDATGTVAWKGHPAALEEKTLEAALAGALPKPLYEWSPAAKGVKSAFQKRAYKSAIEQAEKLPESEGGAEIAKALRTLVTSRVENMKAAYGRGDFLGARTAASELSKDLAGLPELETATQVLADLAASKEAAEVIKGQEKVAKIRGSGLSKRKEVEAAIESLQKLVKEHTGTYVEKEANDLIRQLREREM